MGGGVDGDYVRAVGQVDPSRLVLLAIRDS